MQNYILTYFKQKGIIFHCSGFFFFFLTNVLSHWDFSHEKFGLLFQVKASYDRVTLTNLTYKDHVTNEEARAKIQQAVGPHEDHLTIVKRRK